MTTGPPLIEAVTAVCARLAALGWEELFQAHGLDITADDLASELARPLTIDRSQPRFTDFASTAVRGIEPGRPSHSLLFHGLSTPATPDRREGGVGEALTGYPTPSELMTLLDYVFAARPPTVEDLRARAQGAPLAVVVFAFEYRAAVDTVHRKHADLCFSRIGIARTGTRPANFEGQLGAYSAAAELGHEVAVVPCRYGAFIATAMNGSSGRHGPLDFVEPDRKASGVAHPGSTAAARPKRGSLGSDVADADRRFWVPLHKLFSGPECVDGLDLHVRLHAHHVNEKIRRVHLLFGSAGHDGGWREPDISRPPFIFDGGIAEFGDEADVGAGLLIPTAHDKLVEPATYADDPLSFNVPATRRLAWKLKARA